MENDELCYQRNQVPQGRAKATAASAGGPSGQELNYAEESKELGGGSPIIPEPRKISPQAPERISDPDDM